jgi:hypothetical protein
MHLPHLAAKRTTLSAFAAGLTIRTFSFTQGKTHALTATEKAQRAPSRCWQPSERSVYDVGKDKKRHRLRRQETTRIQA